MPATVTPISPRRSSGPLPAPAPPAKRPFRDNTRLILAGMAILAAALIAILAQTGSFVPAESASLPVIDRIFTRIGASDNLARGRSTFMVEMTETAVILNTATARSFIVLDHDSGRVLAALEPDSKQEPASLTKLMTAYGVFKALKEGRIKVTDMATIKRLYRDAVGPDEGQGDRDQLRMEHEIDRRRPI